MSEKFKPTPEAWGFFTTHKAAIRDVVESFLGESMWQSMHGPFGKPSRYTMADFDKAVEEQDTIKLTHIMNDAWGRAPEDRNVYKIPGFSEMCNLLDCTVDGFFPA